MPSLRRLRARLRRTRQPATPTPSVPRRRAPPVEDYSHTYPELLRLEPERDLTAAFRGAAGSAAPSDALTCVAPGLYRLEPFTEAWVRKLRDEIRAFETWCSEEGVEVSPPNSMNQYGVVLDLLGYRDVFAAFLDILRPVAGAVFPHVGGGQLDEHHAFVVAYGPGADRDLGFHIDDSEVTLNLCLGDHFEGGSLYFEGTRCGVHAQGPTRPGEDQVWAHRPGVALLHAGLHRHGAWPLTAGSRRNLILWTRSAAFREAHDRWACGPWCALHDESSA